MNAILVHTYINYIVTCVYTLAHLLIIYGENRAINNYNKQRTDEVQVNKHKQSSLSACLIDLLLLQLHLISFHISS